MSQVLLLPSESQNISTQVLELVRLLQTHCSISAKRERLQRIGAMLLVASKSQDSQDSYRLFLCCSATASSSEVCGALQVLLRRDVEA